MCGNGNKLFAHSIYDVENSSVTGGRWELFNKVEGDGMPQLRRDRELLDEPKRLVTQSLVPFTQNTTVDIVLNVSVDVRPSVFVAEEVKGLVLTWMSSCGMIMFEL